MYLCHPSSALSTLLCLTYASNASQAEWKLLAAILSEILVAGNATVCMLPRTVLSLAESLCFQGLGLLSSSYLGDNHSIAAAKGVKSTSKNVSFEMSLKELALEAAFK